MSSSLLYQSMTTHKSSILNLPTHFSRLWICFSILLSFLYFALYDAQSSKGPIVQQHVESSGLLDTTGFTINSNTSLVRRDEYSCGAHKPCKNGACCGKCGYCGYGPTYCGDGCASNCGAVAECGHYAKSPGKQCPLNTCCSEFGFVGTRLKDKLQPLYIPEQLLIYHSVVRRKSFVRVRSV